MVFSLEERVQIVLLFGQTGTYSGATDAFNERHPEHQITRKAVSNLVQKFHRTGSVVDEPRSGRPSTGELTEAGVLAEFSVNPQQSARRVAQQHNISRWAVNKVLKNHKFHPYKITLVQELSEDDFDRRIEFCELMTQKLESREISTFEIVFSDEASFQLNGHVNRHNCRYWAQENPHWYRESHTQHPQRLNVWAGIIGNFIIGPFIINGNLNGTAYNNMLITQIIPAINNLIETTATPDGNPIFNRDNVYFQQDGAPPHYARDARDTLNIEFPNHWIGRRGSIEWPARSPDLNPLDFFLWGHLKSTVYTSQPRSLEELRLRIETECRKINNQTFQNVRNMFQQRLYYCMEVQGKQFEHLIK